MEFYWKNGEMLLSHDFNMACSFQNGFAQVRRDDYKWNYIDTNGKILFPDMWFFNAFNFHDNIAVIYNDKQQ